MKGKKNRVVVELKCAGCDKHSEVAQPDESSVFMLIASVFLATAITAVISELQS